MTDDSDAEVASVAGDGEQVVSPSATTEYTLTATGPGGVSTATTTVTVAVPGAPQITEFTAVVVRGSQVQLAWTATNATAFDVFAVRDGDGNAQELLADQVGSGATIAIPASDRQRLRLVARGAIDPDATREVVLENVVVRGDDYDPYDIQGTTPEPEVPGTLRSVLANAAAGSVIGFASDIDLVTLYGVDIERIAAQNQDAHLIFRDDVVVSGPTAAPVTIEAVSGWEPGDPGDTFTYRSRVAFVMADATVELENLVLTGGTFIFNGGGVRNDGDLTLDSVEISGNRAWGRGGAIWNNTGGVLNVLDSVLSGNRAATLTSEEDVSFPIRGGEAVLVSGASGFGGALYNNEGATASFTNTVIDGNEARFSGGAIYNEGAVTLDGTNLTNNVADHNAYSTSGFSYGGAIYNEGDLALTDGDLLDNTAASQGGGLFHDREADSNLGSVLIDGNLAGTSGETGYGGGIMHRHFTGEEDRLVRTDVVLTNNLPQNILVNDEGIRPAGFSTLDAGPRPGRFYLPPGVDPDARNQ
ncbi:MAG TPA: hypothetical protein VLN74_10410 [Ilumatobacteraceae bacterium]|nr:hypothetical protein [Ilumatobacteraceae bacterium]